MKTATLKTLVAITSLVATGAHAADVPQARVSYADLDVQTPAGAAVLKSRIKAAAEQVCGVFDGRDLARRVQFDACVAGAIAGALASVKSPEVHLASIK